MDWVLGVINKETGEYENTWYVNKQNNYKCIGCNGDLILRMGQKNFQSFVHRVKSSCEYFKNPTNSQLLTDANLFLITLYKSDKINLYRKCSICKFKIKMPLVNYADILSIDFTGQFVNLFGLNNKLLCRFGLYNAQPNPDIADNEDDERDDNYQFYQINIEQVIQRLVKNFATGNVELTCCTPTVCVNCVKYL